MSNEHVHPIFQRIMDDFVKTYAPKPPTDNGVRCRCCDQGKEKRFHCPACNNLDAR